MKTVLGGIDIGGTKCAAVLGFENDGRLEIAAKISFPTRQGAGETLLELENALETLMRKESIDSLHAVGISCGGPLDSTNGLVLSPPNLPGWDRIDVVAPFRNRFGVPVALQNDANACAMAEWKWGAGRGTQNMIFLTFGTGMGAGLILNGRLYSGTNDMAGEVGHMRLQEEGPAGYGKIGSFEGFCSGGGIARLARTMAGEWSRAGLSTTLADLQSADPYGLTAKQVAEAAQAGDELALNVIRTVGKQLGRGLAILVDVLNPERIVIGSIYARQQALLEPLVMEELRREALPLSLETCRIVPAGLQENVGDAASLSVALHAFDEMHRKGDSCHV